MSFENANIAKQTFWQGTSLPIIRCTSPIAKKLATISCGSRTCWRIFFDSPCESSQSWKSQDERNQLTNVSVLATIETCSEQAIVESKIRTDSTWNSNGMGSFFPWFQDACQTKTFRQNGNKENGFHCIFSFPVWYIHPHATKKLHAWQFTHLSSTLPAPQEVFELMSLSARSTMFGLGIFSGKCHVQTELKKWSQFRKFRDYSASTQFGWQGSGEVRGAIRALYLTHIR